MRPLKLFLDKQSLQSGALTFLLSLVAIVFYKPLTMIIASWQKDEYSYAYLIPPLAVLLGLHRLRDHPLKPEPTWWGVVIVAAGVLFHLLGQLSGVTIFPQYGFFLTLLGIVLTLSGWKIFILLFPALSYLFFAIPLPTTLYITFSANLQLFSSTLGSQLLQILGVSVFQEGNIIDLGNYKLQVVEACSGLRYIFPLLGFSYLVAYFFNGALWKKGIIFVSALPIAVLLNAARIAIVGVTVNVWGIAAAEGFLHDFEGWIVFLFCVLLLLGEGWLFQVLSKSKEGLDLSRLSLPHGPYFSGPFITHSAGAFLFFLFLCVGLGQITGFLSPPVEVIPQRSTFQTFPTQIGSWKGTPQTLTASEIDLLKVSDYLHLSFKRTEKDRPLSFFVAYYNTQRNKNDLHSPEMCIPGGGWKTLSSSVYRMDLGPKNQGLYVNRALIQKGLDRQLVYYWFEQSGQSRASRFAIKGLTTLHALTTGRTDSALLRLSTPIALHETEEKADQKLEAFFQEVHPLLPNYIPDFLSQK